MEIKISSLEFKYPATPFVIVFFFGIPLSMAIRLQFLQQTENIEVANLIFVTIFITWNIVFFALVDSLYHLLDSYRNIKKIFKKDKSVYEMKETFRNDFQNISMEDSVKEDGLTVSNEVKKEINALEISRTEINDILGKQKVKILQNKQKVLDCFLVYTEITMRPYTTSCELKKLEAYIRTYSDAKEIKYFDFLIVTTDLGNDDLINFGYNMVLHFGYTTQKKFALPLINIFKNLNELDEETIRGQLHYKKPNDKYNINCIKNISEYLNELLQDK